MTNLMEALIKDQGRSEGITLEAMIMSSTALTQLLEARNAIVAVYRAQARKASVLSELMGEVPREH